MVIVYLINMNNIGMQFYKNISIVQVTLPVDKGLYMKSV